jgi:hypothetical protein
MNEKIKFWILLSIFVLSLMLLYFANTALNHSILMGQ